MWLSEARVRDYEDLGFDLLVAVLRTFVNAVSVGWTGVLDFPALSVSLSLDSKLMAGFNGPTGLASCFCYQTHVLQVAPPTTLKRLLYDGQEATDLLIGTLLFSN